VQKITNPKNKSRVQIISATVGESKKEASLVAEALIKMLSPYKNNILTITADNGRVLVSQNGGRTTPG